MKPIHHSSATVQVPAGFSGWWCERCEKPVNLPDELGSPARCPRCHKPTAVWIPPSDPVMTRPVMNDNCRKYTTKEQGAALFAQAKALLDDVEPYDASRAKQQANQSSGAEAMEDRPEQTEEHGL
jgi:hypothetical protein